MPTALRGFRAVTCAGLVAAAIGAPLGADAQVLYGSIVGNVTDSTGSSMPGATVTIEQTETKLKRELVTDAAGAYQFTAVPTGTYTITVTMGGFRAFGRPGCSGLAQLGGARGCEAGGRTAHRGRQRDGGVADPADRSGRSPLGAEGASSSPTCRCRSAATTSSSSRRFPASRRRPTRTRFRRIRRARWSST